MSTSRTFSVGGAINTFVNLGTATVSGAAATTFTLSGLSLSDYKGLVLILRIKNATASISDISMYYNADTTATNYYRQSLNADNATISGARANNGFICQMPASESMTAWIEIANDPAGRPRALSRASRDSVSLLKMTQLLHAWTSATNITDITFSASVASSIDVGSTVTVWGIK